MSTSPPDIQALKTKLKATWMAGDFGVIAKSFATGAADFVHRLHLSPGSQVLDIACGTGNLAIPASKAGAHVTGVDIATNLLEQARARAQTEKVSATFHEGDAEQLPYASCSFDTVMSMFGAMFAPHPELAAAEMIRVCRSGGRITMANWTASGFSGQLFDIVSRYVPRPSIVSPSQWGEEPTVRKRLGEHTTLQLTKRFMPLTYPFPPKEVIEHFRLYFGPTQKTFEQLNTDPSKQEHLRQDLEELWTVHNQRTDGTTLVESEYLEVYAVKH